MVKITVARFLAALGAFALVTGLMTAVVQAGSHDSPDRTARQQLAEVRQATQKYQDVRQACADGYSLLGGYVPNMGLHFWNGTFIEDADEFDITDPQILLYMPRGDGKLVLTSVEYLALDAEIPEEIFSGVAAEAWEPIPIPGVSGLHAWIWKGNPDGVFHSTNPSIPTDGPAIDCS